VLPVELRGESVLLLTNEGAGVHRKSGVRLESLVGAGFDGVTDNLFCMIAEHNEHVSGVPQGPTVRVVGGRKLGVGQSVSSGKLSMSHEVLRGPYREFSRTGRTQAVAWLATDIDA
jgi:hypothetical protein